MEKIASFSIDHDKLIPGVYVSRVDDDITTFDIRMVKPNTPPYLENKTMHSLEHLFATIVRNSYAKDKIIYFGPMGCRTGFYFLVRDMKNSEALALIKDIFWQISKFKGELPGNQKEECGNYLEHNLDGAVTKAKEFYEIIKSLDEYNMYYENL